jgi:hypothetical protein
MKNNPLFEGWVVPKINCFNLSIPYYDDGFFE